jgi:hypothetical protein
VDDICKAGLKAVCDTLFPANSIFSEIKTVTVAQSGQSYTWSYEKTYSLQEIVNKFPTSLKNLATKLQLNTISFAKTSFTLQAASTTYAGKFSTKMSAFQVDNVQIDVMYSPTTSFLASLNFPFTAIKQVVNKFVDNTKINDVFDAFSGSNFFVVIANSDFKSFTGFKPSYIGDLAITEGTLILKATLGLNANSQNNIRKFLTDKLGSTASLELLTQITLEQLDASAALKNIDLTTNLKLSNLELYFQIKYADPTSAEVGIKGKLEFKRSNADVLTFSGALKFTPKDVSFDFRMDGIYRQAFGLTRLHFGNVLLGFGIAYTGTPSQLKLGAEIAIGKDCYDDKMAFVGNDFCIMAKGKVSIGITNPKDNWFYVQLSQLNANSLVRAIAGEKGSDAGKVSRFLSELLSIDGLEASYAVVDVHETDITIQKGFKISGKVTVFSVKVAMVLALDVSEGTFEATLDFLTPIAFKNVVGLYDYSSNTKGPKFSLALKKDSETNTKTFALELSAKVKILGIEIGVQVKADKEELVFKVSGGLFGGKFAAEFIAKSTIDGLKKGEFSVDGSIKIDTSFFKDIFDNVNKNINKLILNMAKQLQKTNKYQDLLKRQAVKKILNEDNFFSKIADVCELGWQLICSNIENTLKLKDIYLAGILDIITFNDDQPVKVKSVGFNTVLDDNAASKATGHKLDLSFSAQVNNKEVSFKGDPVLTDNGQSITEVIFDQSLKLLEQQSTSSMYFKSIEHPDVRFGQR